MGSSVSSTCEYEFNSSICIEAEFNLTAPWSNSEQGAPTKIAGSINSGPQLWWFLIRLFIDSSFSAPFPLYRFPSAIIWRNKRLERASDRVKQNRYEPRAVLRFMKLRLVWRRLASRQKSCPHCRFYDSSYQMDKSWKRALHYGFQVAQVEDRVLHRNAKKIARYV